MMVFLLLQYCAVYCDGILAPPVLCRAYIVMVFLLDQTSVAVLHSSALPIRLSSYSQAGGEGLELLGYWLVISNRGINSVSDAITTIINRSAPSRPFNFPQMIEKKYIEPAFMFSDFAIGPFRLTSGVIHLKPIPIGSKVLAIFTD